MWILVLILTAPSIPGEHVVAKPFVEYEACVKEQQRLTENFQASYPGDTDYQFVCRFVSRAI